MLFLCADFFRKILLGMRVSKSLDPDQTRRFVRPDLVPNCLQRLSADGTSRQIRLMLQSIIHEIAAIKFLGDSSEIPTYSANPSRGKKKSQSPNQSNCRFVVNF